PRRSSDLLNRFSSSSWPHESMAPASNACVTYVTDNSGSQSSPGEDSARFGPNLTTRLPRPRLGTYFASSTHDRTSQRFALQPVRSRYAGGPWRISGYRGKNKVVFFASPFGDSW